MVVLKKVIWYGKVLSTCYFLYQNYHVVLTSSCTSILTYYLLFSFSSFLIWKGGGQRYYTYNKLKLTIFLSAASTYGIANPIDIIYDLDCRGPWMEAFCLLYKICFENQCDWNGELYLSCHQPNDRWSTICGSRVIYGVRPKWRYVPTFFKGI